MKWKKDKCQLLSGRDPAEQWKELKIDSSLFPEARIEAGRKWTLSLKISLCLVEIAEKEVVVLRILNHGDVSENPNWVFTLTKKDLLVKTLKTKTVTIPYYLLEKTAQNSLTD